MRPPDMRALGRLKTGVMNKTEAAYAQELKLRHRAGEVAWYLFEGIKLRLADNTFYSPDFAVMLANGELELHEVKAPRWHRSAPHLVAPPLGCLQIPDPKCRPINSRDCQCTTSPAACKFTKWFTRGVSCMS